MTHYLTLEQLIALHVDIVCNKMGEPFLGILSENMLETALARPRHAADYEAADLMRQACYLFHGVLMNHGFVQGNKRTAYAALEWFLFANGVGQVVADDREIIDMCLAAVTDQWGIDRIDSWLRRNLRAN